MKLIIDQDIQCHFLGFPFSWKELAKNPETRTLPCVKYINKPL